VKLFSEEYRRLNFKLHTKGRFGRDGQKWRKWLLPIIHEFGIKTLLDYGCGQGTLWKGLVDSYGEWKEPPLYTGYDPCVKGREALPLGVFDLVVCTDVLEHIEPEYLDNVLHHINMLTGRVLFLNIALLEAKTLLPDGRNAHRIVESSKWWREKLSYFFPTSDWIWKEAHNDKPHKRLSLVLWRGTCSQ
jgi:hypothetical protein